MGPMVNGTHVASTCTPVVTCSVGGYGGGGGRDTEVKEATDLAVVGRRKFLFSPLPFFCNKKPLEVARTSLHCFSDIMLCLGLGS